MSIGALRAGQARFRRLQAGAAALALAAGGMIATAGSAQAASCSSNNLDLIAVNGTDAATGGSAGLAQLAPTMDAIDLKTSYTTKRISVPYDTKWGNPLEYANDVAQGEAHLRSTLQSEYKACKSTSYVIVGYSLGAHATGDALDASGVQLSSGIKNQIKAVVLYGDPTYRAGEPYDFGTGTNNGPFFRAKGDLQAYASKIASYCDSNDVICQATGVSQTVHESYPTKRAGAAASFVRGKLGH